MKSPIALALAAVFGGQIFSSSPRLGVAYSLQVGSGDYSGVTVNMHVRGAPADFRIAMVTHPEYDDQYWRYVTDLTAETPRGAVVVTREDSAVWHISGAPGDVTIHYRVNYPVSPSMQQPAWKAHLSTEGGLVGGPHSFLYVVGADKTPITLSLTLPDGWTIATGLTPSASAQQFTAPDAATLIDSPIMVGRVRAWRFEVDGTPHDVAYLGRAAGVSFDSARFVASVERIARATVQMFRSMPYRRFQFLFEDGSFGGLEHLNSISIGVRSADVARDPDSPLPQIAHEFFHTWNEVHLRPVSWIGIRHVPPMPTGELWWAEGVTLNYADLLLRRAGLHTLDSTRVAHLERLITAYYANPSHGLVSPEHVSREFNLPPGGNGDYTPSMYTQGEAIGTILDLMIRRGSHGVRTLDDVLRDLARRFSPPRGYAGGDIERAVALACGCVVKAFFDASVRGATPVDFNSALASIGLHAVVTWEAARTETGAVMPDLRLSAYLLAGEQRPRLLIWFPATAWGRAGLHTGDGILSWNGAPMADVAQVRSAINQLQPGDTVRLVVSRGSTMLPVKVAVAGYDRPVVRIEALAGASAPVKAMQARWIAGW